MNFKTKLYFLLIVSFILLFISLYLSYSSIDSTSNMIDNIETKQIKLYDLAYKISNDVEINQSNILQAIILKDTNSIKSIHKSFDKLQTVVYQLEKFINDNKIEIKGMNETIITIKRRMIGYKAVENSVIEAIESKDKEDIEDSLIGFNAITIKFSDDTNRLITLTYNQLQRKVSLLKDTNNQSQIDILYTFLLAMLLISFAVYQLSQLHNTVKKELIRAETAEEEQKKLQSQLLKYNDDLESEIARKTKELHQKIYTNFLSGLPNRNRLLEDASLYNFQLMALLNIDKFQKFNDVYGEEIGNVALKLTADFLKEQIDDVNTLLYHIGGDEFVFAVKNSNEVNEVSFTEYIESILKDYSRKHFTYDNKQFNFIMSAGVAFSGEKKMLAYADMALKDAKKRNIQLSIFNDDKKLEKTHLDDIECHKKLLSALEDKRLISYFQPIVPIQDHTKPVKYESLARLLLKDGEVIPPFKFIDVAKSNRIYDRLTKHVFENTLNTISKYKIPCTLNLSMEDIESEKTLRMFYSRFDQFEFNHLLTVELLETEEFKDYKSVYDFCIKVRSYGIKIALDDFGSGYSNFSYILKLPIDYIKIDATLISNIDRDQYSRIMVETIVTLAKRLNIETIAEFVSSKEILDVVKELNVDYAQGYHIGRPEAIENHMKSDAI